jgi:hypothetical protein
MGRFTWMTRAAAVAAGTAAALAIGTTPAHAYKLDGGMFEGKALAFLDFQSYDTGDSAADDAASGFHFTRAYFEMRYHPVKSTTYRVTLDAKGNDQTNADGSKDQFVYVKYAYAQIKIAGEHSHYVKFGLHHTPVIDYYQTDMWGHRFVDKTFVDSIGVYTSSDLGISFLGDVNENFNYYVSFTNGEGYGKGSDGSGYAFQGRLEGRAAGARVGVHGMSNSAVGGVDTTDRTVYGVYAAYFADFGNAAAEYVSADDDDKAKFDGGSGYSVLVNGNIPAGNKTVGFARYDSFTAKDVSGVDPATKLIVGVETEVQKGCTAAIAYTSIDTGVPAADTTSIIGVYAKVAI